MADSTTVSDTVSDLLASIHAAGAALLDALEAERYDDAHARAAERGALVERLKTLGAPSSGAHAALAARLTAQHRALTERMEGARTHLAEALSQAERLHRASGAYAAPTAPLARLHATG